MNRRLTTGVIPAFCGAILICASVAAENAPPYEGKKIIQWGRVPDIKYIRNNIREMENVAVDGILIPDPHGWRTWSAKRFDSKDLQPLVDDLRATPFKRFTDNFLKINSYFPPNGGPVDWFAREWSSIAHNAGVMARAARQGGLKGLVFDCEQYGKGDSRMWDYSGAKLKRPFKEYSDKAKERGKEFIRTINKEFPGITIFTTWGYELPIVYPHPSQPGGQPNYALLIPFLDGIIEAADPGTVLVDGYEYGYGFVSERAFMGGKEMIKDTARNTITSAPKAFDEHVQFGCPVFPDMWSLEGRLPFVFDKVERNVVTPAIFRTKLANALKVTDKYVWIYTQTLRWWQCDLEFGVDAPIRYREANAPEAYIEAVSLARRGPAPGSHPDRITWPARKLELPTEAWGFALDATVGQVSSDCVKPEYDDSSWQKVKIGGVPPYTGKAWYRFTFSGPELTDNTMRAFLSVMTDDEFTKVWVNGEYVGEHDTDRDGRRSFAIEVSEAYRPGRDNLLVLQMDNQKGPSGITGTLKLFEAGYAQIK